MLLCHIFKWTAQLVKGSHRWRLMRVLTSILSDSNIYCGTGDSNTWDITKTHENTQYLHHSQHSGNRWATPEQLIASGHCPPPHPDCGFLILLLPQACPWCWDTLGATLGLLMQKVDSTAARWSHLVSNFTSASRWGIRPKLISLPIKGYQDLFLASFHFWGLTGF